MDCIFCAIVAHRLPASFIVEEERVVAFLDIHPWRDGHALVVPRRCVRRLAELDGAERAAMFDLGVRVGEAARSALPCDDANLLVNDGPAAWQTVPHAHLHVVPRRKGDSAGMLWRLVRHPIAQLRSARRDELDAIAQKLGHRLRGD